MLVLISPVHRMQNSPPMPSKGHPKLGQIPAESTAHNGTYPLPQAASGPHLTCCGMTARRAIATAVGLVAIISGGCTSAGESTSTSAADTQSGAPTTKTPTTETTVTQMLDLPPRPGDQPSVTDGVPHIQLDQNSSDEMLAELAEWAFSLNGVVELPSQASLPGARALTVAPGLPVNSEAIIVDREFAHIHPQPNGGSLHLRLPQVEAQEVVDEGWGEYHPFAISGSIPNLIMVYAPRDHDDLRSIKAIIEASVAFATST